MFPKIGPLELIIILVIVTMLFGVGKLPEVFGAVGRGIREFRNASKEAEELADDPLSTKSTKSSTSDAGAAAEADVTDEAAESSSQPANQAETSGAEQNGAEPETSAVGEADSRNNSEKNSSA